MLSLEYWTTVAQEGVVRRSSGTRTSEANDIGYYPSVASGNQCSPN